jgi:hypothetical protein
MNRQTSVFAILKDRQALTQAVDDMKSAGFSNNDISALFADEHGTKDFAHEKSTKAPEGAAIGAGTGAVLGGGLGWLVGLGSLAIPGVGPFIAAGPIMAALAGAGVLGAIGSLSGALIGMGLPEFEAKRYEGKLQGGRVLLSVHCNNGDQVDTAKRILKASSAEDISSSGEAKVPDVKREEITRKDDFNIRSRSSDDARGNL